MAIFQKHSDFVLVTHRKRIVGHYSKDFR